MSKLKQLTMTVCSRIRLIKIRLQRRLIVLAVFVLAALGALFVTQSQVAVTQSAITATAITSTTVTTTLSASIPATPTTTSTSLSPATTVTTPTQRKASKEPTRGIKRTPVSAASAPKPASSNCSSSQAAAHACWDGLIGQYSWNTSKAFRIMWCESRGNPNAKNAHSTARGLFQILGGPLDPEANVRQAYAMYSQRGWQPWVCK